MGICCSKHAIEDEHSHGSRAAAGTTAEALTTAGVTVSLAAGAGLLEVAAHIPFVAPIAFLIGAIILSCQEAESLRSDCKEFSMVAQEVERVLLKAKNLHEEKDTVESMREVLEEGMAFVRTLNKTNVVLQVIGSKHNANELKSCRDRLVSLINTMTFSGVVDMNVMMSMKFDEGKKLDILVKNLGGPEVVLQDDEKCHEIADAMHNGIEAMNLLLHKHTHKQSKKIIESQEEHTGKLDVMQQQLDEQRILSMHNKEHAEVMARQNQILMKQVEQMNMMMMQSQMQLTEFMTRFPLRNNEAVTQIAIEKLGIEELDKPIDMLEDLLDEFILFTREPGLQLMSIMIDLITADDQVMMAARGYNVHDDAWMGKVNKSEAKSQFGSKMSKKMTVCQYTVAEDKVCCFRSKDKAPQLVSGSAYFESIAGDLSNADANVAKSLENMFTEPGFDVATQASNGEITVDKAREVAVRMGIPLRSFKMIETFAGALAMLQSNDGLYLGAPWRIQGKTMGVCCCFIKAKPEDQLTQDEMVAKLKLDRLAKGVEEAIESCTRSPIHRAKMDATYTPTLTGMSSMSVSDMPSSVPSSAPALISKVDETRNATDIIG